MYDEKFVVLSAGAPRQWQVLVCEHEQINLVVEIPNGYPLVPLVPTLFISDVPLQKDESRGGGKEDGGVGGADVSSSAAAAQRIDPRASKRADLKRQIPSLVAAAIDEAVKAAADEIPAVFMVRDPCIVHCALCMVTG